MKVITNTSLQSWNLPLRTEEGIQGYFIQPDETVTVPASYITDHVIRYQLRNLISIRDA